jgi:hypothetical protein
MSRKSFGEESAGNRKQSPNQWLQELTRDFGGWWPGICMGALMMLYGAFRGFDAFFASGAIMVSIAVPLTVVGWFTRK